MWGAMIRGCVQPCCSASKPLRIAPAAVLPLLPPHTPLRYRSTAAKTKTSKPHVRRRLERAPDLAAERDVAVARDRLAARAAIGRLDRGERALLREPGVEVAALRRLVLGDEPEQHVVGRDLEGVEGVRDCCCFCCLCFEGIVPGHTRQAAAAAATAHGQKRLHPGAPASPPARRGPWPAAARS